MFGIRTPAKKRTERTADVDRLSPAQTASEQAGPSQRGPELNVRRSIGEWESGLSESQPHRTPTPPKKTTSIAPPKPKPKATLSQEGKLTIRRQSTEAAVSPPTQEKPKYADRLAEARACVTKAKVNLGNSRNIKTEIKAEVTQAIDRLYQLVKEAESAREQKKNTEPQMEKEPERENEPQKEREIESELTKRMEEHAKLIRESNEKMENLKEAMEQQKEMMQKATYASVAAASQPKNQPCEQTVLHSVVVTSVDELETGEEVLERIRKVVNAKESGITVERIRKAKDRKIIVGCRTEEERRRVKERISEAKELKVEDIKNKDPLVILRDVQKYNTDEDVLSALRNQNKGLLGEWADLRMEIAYKKRTRNPNTHHIVMRVAPKIWQQLTGAGTVLVDLQRVRAEDQSPLVQCSLCLGYGHGRRFCKETVEKCSHCGGPHMKTECADWLADVAPSCPNCVHAKIDKADHNAFSSACPIRRKWETLARATIAYC